MKYAIEPYDDCPIIDEVDELILTRYYNPKSIFEYIEKHPNQKLLITYPMDDNPPWWKFFQSIEWTDYYYPYIKEHSICQNIIFHVSYYDWKGMMIETQKQFKNCGYSFCFDEGCKTWGEVYEQLAAGASSILIYGELCFDIIKLAEVIHTAGAEIRIMPDVAQTSAKVPYSDIRKFFIRPEDIDLYEPYVDVFWLASWNRIKSPTYLSIYRDDKHWYGKLKEIIFGLEDSEIDSRNITARFTKQRLNCNQECIKGGKCDICGTVEEISDTLSESGLYIKLKENINE